MPGVKIFGKQIPTWGVALVVVGGGVAVFYVIKQKNAASASTTTQTGIDPVTGLPYTEDSAIDPLTGQSYLAEAQQYGSVSAADAAYADSSGLGTTSAAGTAGTTNPEVTIPGEGTIVTGTTYGSNSAWAQAVEAGLTDIGYSSTDVSAALGRFLGSLTLTTTQAGIVEAAIAEYGEPPVGSYSIKLAGTGGGTSSTVTIPNVDGITVDQASQILTASGLKPSGPRGEAGVEHIVTGTNPAIGMKVAGGSAVTLHYKTISEGSKGAATVPRVIGQSQVDAFKAISAAGFKPRTKTLSVKGEVLYVTSQSPAGGKSAAKGSTVTVTSKKR